MAAGQTALVSRTPFVVTAGYPDIVVFDTTTLESRQQIATISLRIAGTFVGAFGSLALVLAAAGIYGVTSYTTRQRTQKSAFA